ncbi:hypothetical protein ACQ4PT_069555 [Festuca glaucescens]
MRSLPLLVHRVVIYILAAPYSFVQYIILVSDPSHTMEKASLFLAMIIYLLICMSSRCNFAHATDALFPGQSLSGNHTLLSKNGAFELGFNCLSPPCSEFTLGIWYVNSSTCKALLVWVVLVEQLYHMPLEPYLTSDPWTSSFSLSYGNLQLTSLAPYYSSIIWSSATGMKDISASAVAVLLDNGNLVIRDQVNSSLLFWQSFDSLGDTLLPGGWLGLDVPYMYSAKNNDSACDSSYLARNTNQPKGFTIVHSTGCLRVHSLQYSGTFPSWIDFLEDEDSLFLSKNSDIYVRLDSDGTLSAAKLGGCGTLLWSARHSWQENSDSMKQKSHSKIKTLVLTTIAIVLGLFLMLFWIRKRMERPLSCNGALIVFSEAHIKKATKSFSEKLGEGGFGCVFKGELPGFSLVAVKKLKSIAQGEKQFRAEVQTIGMIHHINLVRLFGFCVQGRTRLLIYEYMENGSLNSHLFSKKSAKLTWDLRYHIALGTARGLAYLHEECKECIIHCDMKPDNILLDAEFCPKIADFGMAKLLGRDFSRALTTMRGTIGYLAPEWISGLPITHKADVYSYGMMLLEIIYGRRNAEKIREGKYTYFPIFAAIKVNEGDAISLLDPRLESQADIEQLNRVCRIACWCIQDAEDHRPMMRQVVHMLESDGSRNPTYSKITSKLCWHVGLLLLCGCG